MPFEYPVVFTEDLFGTTNSTLADVLAARDPRLPHRALVVADEGLIQSSPGLLERVSAWFAQRAGTIILAADPLLVPAGEAAKNDPGLAPRLHELFLRSHLDRHSFVIIVGGGSTLDAVGYAAATAHRGLRTVRVPTTVLAQNDSGVGVKNGINAFGIKNFLGTFLPPYAVFVDSRFLDTLPARDAIAGMAEAVKVALIRDAGFFSWLEENAEVLSGRHKPALVTMIRRCAELHLAHIASSGDPFEMGSARPLDFGHWAAHKLESLTNHELRHGESVALGLRIDSRYAVLVGLLAEQDFERVDRLLTRLGLPRWHAAADQKKSTGEFALFDGLDDFREHLGGQLTITLIADIGRAVEVHDMDRGKLLRALELVRARAATS